MVMRKDVKRLLVLLIGIIILLGFSYVTSVLWSNSSVIYLVLAGLSILGIYTFDKIGDGKITGIDDNWIFDIFVGIGIGIGILILRSINILGVVSLDDTANIINRVFGAGIIETVFFFVLILAYFSEKIKIGKKHIPYFLAVLIASIIFAVYHLKAIFPDGMITLLGIQSNAGFFISAIVLGLIWGYTLKWTKSAMPLIVSHMIVNAWILKDVILRIIGQ